MATSDMKLGTEGGTKTDKWLHHISLEFTYNCQNIYCHMSIRHADLLVQTKGYSKPSLSIKINRVMK